LHMTKSRRNFLKYTLPTVAWASLMLIVSSLPGTALPQGPAFFEWDKLAHAGEYAIFALLFFRYLVGGRNVPIPRAYLLVAVCVPLFGILDELHQVFIPFRTCSWQDMVADAGGALIALLLVQIQFIRKRIVRDSNNR
ncbi:MAG: VanZ family protein, partial [Chitinivibrionales bacterium]